MGDGIRIIRSVVVNQDVRTRQRTKGEGLDELASVPGHGHADLAAGALKAAKDFNSLVSSYSAGHAECDAVLAVILIAIHVKSKCNTAKLWVQYWWILRERIIAVANETGLPKFPELK